AGPGAGSRGPQPRLRSPWQGPRVAPARTEAPTLPPCRLTYGGGGGVSTIGDRCKGYESAESHRHAMRGLPILARLDGRAFHTFTRGMARPYDPRMSRCMIETARFLVEEMHALVGYTQSDEITLVWYVDSASRAEYPFGGRYQKLASVLAGLA